MATKRFGTVYRVTCLVNGKNYIGVTTKLLDQRLRGHINDARTTRKDRPFLKAIRKYGAENFIIEPIASSWDEENLLKLEALLIEQEGSMVPAGYNACEGGLGVLNPTLETREKIRQRRIGVRHTAESRQLISQNRRGKPGGNKGIPLSEEQKAKMSATRKARFASGAISPTIIQMTDEHKAMLLKINLGKKASDETKAKMSLVHKGKHIGCAHSKNICLYRDKKEAAG